MRKLIVTLALAMSMLASAGAATADPSRNTCHRLRNAIASGTRVSALPPRLVRACFGDPAPARPAAATPVQAAVASSARR